MDREFSRYCEQQFDNQESRSVSPISALRVPPESGYASRSEMHSHAPTQHEGFNSDHVVEQSGPFDEQSIALNAYGGDEHGPVPLSGKYSWTVSTGKLSSWWILEVACLVVSVGCIVAIAAILKVWDGKTSTSYGFYFSLNTLVGFLGSTIARTALIFAVSAAIGQGKWIWFRKRRSPLSTFDLIDNASRGPKGSAELLFHLKGQHILSLGAIAITLSVLMEPALQALITTVGSLRPEAYDASSASISSNSYLDGGFESVVEHSSENLTKADGNEYEATTTTPDFSVISAMYDGFRALNPASVQDPSFFCPSGNCTWPVFVSLAVCNSCFDVSAHIVRSTNPFLDPDGLNEPSYGDQLNGGDHRGLGTVYNLPYLGLHINNLNGLSNEFLNPMYMTAGGTADPNSTINFRDSQTLLLAITTLRASDAYVGNTAAWEDSTTVATECGLSFCLNAYNTTSTLGELTEEVVKSTSKKIPASWEAIPFSSDDPLVDPYLQGIKNVSALGTLDWNPVHHLGYYNRTDFKLDASDLNASWYKSNDQFNITQSFIDSTQAFLLDLSPIPNSTAGTPLGVYNGSGVLVFPTPILQPMWGSPNTTSIFDALAKSLTNAIRSAGGDGAAGEVQYWVYRYKIRWGFFALPVIVVLGGSLFTILSIIETRKARLATWKNSSLATMAFGPDEETRREIRCACTTQRLEKACRGTVYLRQDQGFVELASCSMMKDEEKIDPSI